MKIKLVTLCAAAALSGAAIAETTPEDVVNTLFDGMRAGDGSVIRALVVPDARLDRLNGDGSIRGGNFERWISWVDTQNDGDANEQIFGVQTMSRTDELATVWAPFTLVYKGEMVGCGVNQFTLAKSSDGWRVVYGIDKHEPKGTDCNAFRAGFE
ncbi:nuclear transport factor 2 family protein [Kordiimonas aquimaris]|uniref:nuclear transport factor 2 family protein n=1 Tax=Kordiimonas aquimaris TaxID=707591 RepID=UPI0021CE6973|nr:nuclear transport factor 2 family protein [Kordiimonas aquimaris]